MDTTSVTTPLTTGTARSATPETSAAAAAKTGISADFETFLKMLTVQMQNQDPLNPIDSKEFATQLAQFSGVEQQVKSNELLKDLGTQMALMGMTQLANWVGMEARADAPAYFGGQPVTLAPQVPESADSAKLVVKNAAGAEVQRLDLPLSNEPISWVGTDGEGNPLPAGEYNFSLETYRAGEITGTAPVEVYGTIREARMEDGKTVLMLEGGGKLTADQITALRNPAL
jgi:flagellar basal-body rod modification protein FlgD